MNIRHDRQNMLITGVSGLLGNNLAHYFARKFDVLGLYNNHPVDIPGIRTDRCDLTNREDFLRIVKGFYPSAVIHCASLANVDQCEHDPQRSRLLNVACTQHVADALDGVDAHLIYISTDSVYEGTKGNYREGAAVRPLNIYGQTKWEGEGPVLERHGGLVLRTNLFGWNIQDKKSLGEWILDQLLSGREVGGFDDAVFSTIYTMELARVLDVAIKNNLSGLYNCGSADACSKYEFALKIADRFGFDRQLIRPISIDDLKFQARRGKDLSFSTAKIEAALGYRMPTIDQSVDEFYQDYRCGVPEEIKKNGYGRAAAFSFIPYGRQWIDENDIQEVVQVLRSERITQGPKVDEFEKSLADYCNVKYAVAVNSGTSALHIACLAAGVEPGHEVITSPITFVASANCAAYCGAKPVFADIDPATYNIRPEEIEKTITENTRAVIPVHFAGQSCDMERIHGIVRSAEKKFGTKIYIIEDACHALGSLYKNTRIGSCVFSDMTVTSFHPVKHITTAEGGAVLTGDDFTNKKLRQFRSHGITSAPEDFINKHLAFASSNGSPNPWYYEQISLGYNYRITDIQCAFGVSQIKRLDDFRRRRREIVNKYNEAFEGIEGIQIPYESIDCDSNFHLYVLLFDFHKIGFERASFMQKLKTNGVQTQVHYIPVHFQPFYRQHFATQFGQFKFAEEYYERCLSLPLYPAMDNEDIAKVIGCVRNCLSGR